MFTVLVTLQVEEAEVEAFVVGVRANATASLRDEPGGLRFDVHRATDDPTRFFLYELYVDRAAFEVAHRSAPHYEAWRRVVERCVIPGSLVLTTGTPAFPDELRP